MQPGDRGLISAMDIEGTLELQEQELTENCDFIIKYLDAEDVHGRCTNPGEAYRR